MSTATCLPSVGESVGANRRASRRVSLAVPIVLWGKNSAGNSFIENTQTLDVNRRGAKAMTKYLVNSGERLEVAVPHLQRKASAIVVWSTSNSDEYQKIGIDLGENRDFWGLTFPDESAGISAASTAEERETISPAVQP